MKNGIITKINGNVIVEHFPEGTDAADYVSSEKERDKNSFKVRHLCLNCKNCRADLCDKVLDIRKRSLGKYAFIKDGMQIYDEKGEMQYFAVINCDNYVKEVRERQVTLGPVNRR